ncbi:hypothetical protein ACFS5N_08290 [Mucilaginibacter ximonensis]|uniref:Uncharacterized protein n=1 Tax=Mucilaginibacter ximonensis TaxID=538021 RepID=A0ABW5YCA7_9SPHI
MKALILTLSIVGLVSAAKAQQTTDKLLPSQKVPAWQQSFDKQLSLGNPLTSQPEAKSKSTDVHQLVAVEVTDHMPIAKPANTDKAMPIIRTDRTAYNMPIVGKKSIDKENSIANTAQP